jgi:hypothetical protein
MAQGLAPIAFPSKTDEEALGLGLGKAHRVEHVLRSFEPIRANP